MANIFENPDLDKLKSFDNKLYFICGLLTVAIFTLDINLPLGVAGGVPYITVVLIALWSPKRHFAIYLAVICSVMTLLGYYFSPPGGELWKVIFNRTLALFAIWITAFLAMKWKSYEEELLSAKAKIETEKENIYMATIHGAQHILNNLLNQLQLVKMEINKYIDFDKRILKIFDDILAEASSLMKSLSAVKQVDEETIKQSVYPKPKSRA